MCFEQTALDSQPQKGCLKWLWLPGNSPADVIAQQSAVDKFLFHLMQTASLNAVPASFELLML